MSGWSKQTTDDGKAYWFNHDTNQSSWQDPRAPGAVVHQHTEDVDAGSGSSREHGGGWVDEGAVVSGGGGSGGSGGGVGGLEMMSRGGGGAASKLGDVADDDIDGPADPGVVNFSSIARRSMAASARQGLGKGGMPFEMEAHSVDINRVLVTIHFKQEMKGSRDERMQGRKFLIEINQNFHETKMRLFRMQSIILCVIMTVLAFPVAAYYLITDLTTPAAVPHFCLGAESIEAKCPDGIKIAALVVFLLVAIVALPTLCIAYVVVATGFFGKEPEYLEKCQRSTVGRTLSICWLLSLTSCMLCVTFLTSGGWGLLTLFYIATYSFFPFPIIDLHYNTLISFIAFSALTLMRTDGQLVRIPVLGLLALLALWDAHKRDLALCTHFVQKIMLLEQAKHVEDYDRENTRLLQSMLPAPIVEKLKLKIPVPAEYFAQVTVIFVQICNFSHLAEILTSHKLVKLLNTIYSKFDDVTEQHEVYKIETVGEVYVAVAGCPKRIANHGVLAANFALAAQKAMLNLGHELSRLLPMGETVQIHVGLNTGQINAGIVGRNNPRFKLFGDTVNTASRMETTCPPGKVQCSAATAAQLGGYVLTPRTVQVKGKGQMKTFIIEGHKAGTRVIVMPRPIRHLDSALLIRKITGKGVVSPRLRSILLVLAQRAKRRVAEWKQDEEVRDAMAEDEDNRDCETFSRCAEAICCVEHSVVSTCNGLNNPDDDEEGDEWEPPAPTCLSTCVNKLSSLLAWTIGIDAKIVEEIQRNEKAYQSHHRAATLTKLRFCVLAGMGLLLLLELPAFVGPYLSTSQTASGRSYIAMAVGSTGLWGVPPMLIIHGILAPACGILLLLAYTKLFEDAQYRYVMRFIVGIFFFFNGLGAIYIATVILLTGANYAEVAVLSYLVILFNVSALSVNWRVGLGILIVFLYLATCITIDSQTSSSDDNTLASSNAMFIGIYFIIQTLPVLANEQYQRENFVKRESLQKQQLKLETEQGKAENLLSQLLPPKIVAQLKSGRTDVADDFQSVSVLFTDMKGFTAYSAQLTPDELVEFLNNMYSAFDEVLEEHGLTKVEVIGDAYYVVGGCPDVLPAQEHAVNTVDAALAMLRMLPRVIVDPTVQMRVGVHSGPVVAAIVGKRDPRYHLFGATVSYAEKMESHGIPGRVHVSEATYDLLKDIPRFRTESRGGIEIDGEEGKKMTYLVTAPPKRLASSRAQQLGNILLG